MKVKELIERLKELDGELPVTIYHDNLKDFGEAMYVEVAVVGEDTPYCKGTDYDELFNDGDNVVIISGY